MPAQPPRDRQEHIAQGIGLRLASVGLFAIMAALLKLTSLEGVVAIEMLFYRAVFGLPIVVLWVATSQGFGALRTRRPLAHLGRSALGLASILCTFQALILLPLADATTIGFTAPAFATILSWLVLRERVGRHRWLAVAIGFVGVLIVMRPGASAAVPLAGVAFALAAALGTASVVITLRQLRHTEHVAAIVFWFFVASALVSTLALPFVGHVPEPRTLGLLALAGIAGGLMQIALTASLQKAPVSVLSPLDYLQIVVTVALGWLFFAEVPTANTLAGAALIVASGLWIAWREHRLRPGADDEPIQPPGAG